MSLLAKFEADSHKMDRVNAQRNRDTMIKNEQDRLRKQVDFPDCAGGFSGAHLIIVALLRCAVALFCRHFPKHNLSCFLCPWADRKQHCVFAYMREP